MAAPLQNYQVYTFTRITPLQPINCKLFQPSLYFFNNKLLISPNDLLIQIITLSPRHNNINVRSPNEVPQTKNSQGHIHESNGSGNFLLILHGQAILSLENALRRVFSLASLNFLIKYIIYYYIQSGLYNTLQHMITSKSIIMRGGSIFKPFATPRSMILLKTAVYASI